MISEVTKKHCCYERPKLPKIFPLPNPQPQCSVYTAEGDFPALTMAVYLKRPKETDPGYPYNFPIIKVKAEKYCLEKKLSNTAWENKKKEYTIKKPSVLFHQHEKEKSFQECISSSPRLVCSMPTLKATVCFSKETMFPTVLKLYCLRGDLLNIHKELLHVPSHRGNTYSEEHCQSSFRLTLLQWRGKQGYNQL